MQRTIRLQLNPTPEQASVLLETMKQYSECFNAVSRLGFSKCITNGVTLHKETYYPLREQFPELPSQLVCASRVKATEAVKSALTLQKKGKNVSCPTSQAVPIRYDARTYRMLPERVSLASVSGRQIVPFTTNEHAERWLGRSAVFDSADLVYCKGGFFLHVTLTIPVIEFVANGQVVGVDLGLTRPAVCSNKTFHGKKRWKEVDRRYFRLKRSLQAKGTKSAKRHLKRLSGKVQRFRRDCDHVVSRQIIQSVEPGTTVVVENLVDILTRTKQRGRKSRRRMHSWSFVQLRSFLGYKAEEKGCVVVGVDPRHTSQTCSRCGYVHRSNRSSQSVFQCRSCGYELNADYNASINIARKHLAGDGISVSGGPTSTGLSSQGFDSRDKLAALAVSC